MRIEDLIISEDISVLQAMQKLDEVGKKILFIAPDLKLQAVLTDGDVRRHILHGGRLDAKVGEMANYKFMALPLTQRHKAADVLGKKSITALPVLDSDGRIADVVFLDDTSVRVQKALDLPVVIMAGGLGTRLYPYTKILPKPLIPVAEKPIVEHLIDRFKNSGCKDFAKICGRGVKKV